MKVWILISTLLLMHCHMAVQETHAQAVTERVFLHTDRESYVAGDYLLYTMYRKGDPEIASKYAYLIIRNQKCVVASVRLEFSGNSAFGAVLLPDTLQSGFYQVLCFTNVQRNAPDTFFKKELIISNRFDNDLNSFNGSGNVRTDTSVSIHDRNVNSDNIIVHANKQKYGSREKITISIGSEEFTETDPAEISVSVSEIITGAANIDNTTNVLNINLKHIIKGSLTYDPETSGAILSGKVISATNTANNIVFVSTVDTVPNLQYARTDSSGTFRILLNPYYSGKELVIKLKDDREAFILPDNRSDNIPPFNPSGEMNVPGIREYTSRMGQIATLRKYYNQILRFDTLAVFRASAYIPRVYYSNFSKIIPAEYIELKDFQEISTEIIPALKIRKSKEAYIVSYPYLKYTTGTNDAPAIFFNGVPVDGIDQFVNSGSSEIRRIETLPVTRYFGDLKFDGILSVFSHDLDIRKISFKAPSTIFKAELSEPYTKPVKFVPENLGKHHPDLRQVLFWEPHIIVKGKPLPIECFASDIKGTYRITVNGITKSGVSLGGSAIINIDEE